jgi:hypothetical protein
MRVLEGAHCWGSLDGGLATGGVLHLRLVLLPPGASRGERRLLRLWRSMPGVMVTLVAGIAMTWQTGSRVAVLTATVLVGIGFVVVGRRCRRTRRSTIVLHAEHIGIPGERSGWWECADLAAYAAVLTRAEHAMARGELDPVRFELVWDRVYAACRERSAEASR